MEIRVLDAVLFLLFLFLIEIVLGVIHYGLDRYTECDESIFTSLCYNTLTQRKCINNNHFPEVCWQSIGNKGKIDP